MNGLINIKKVNYGKEEWAGNYENGYKGLKKHATMCTGLRKLRVLIFVSESLENVLMAKKEIRNLLKKGNYPIHINDCHNEAIELADIYFNNDKINWLNSASYKLNLKHFNACLSEFKEFALKNHFDLNKMCLSGSLVLELYGLRKAKDIDVIHSYTINFKDEKNISSHYSENKYYSDIFDKIIIDYNKTMTYEGIKILSIKELLRMKMKRHEFIKDFIDIFLIVVLRNLNKYKNYFITILYFNPKRIILECLQKLIRRKEN